MAMRNMLRDRVTLVKPDGRRFENVLASVQSGMVFTDDPKLPIEEGDIFERTLPNGLLEAYEVTDRGYMEGIGSIDSHYQSKIRKVATNQKKDASSTGHVGGASSFIRELAAGKVGIRNLAASTAEKETTPMLKLFVSHSSKDREVVTLLVDLLRSALKLSANEIRCTSVDGYRLPGGAETIDQLRRELNDAQAFVGIISAASLESMYVAFELGARWGARKHLLPVLAPGTDASGLAGPLSGINALRCESAGQLHQLIADLSKVLSADVEPAAVFQREIETILRFARNAEESRLSESTDAPKENAGNFSVSDLEFEILVAVAKHLSERITVSEAASVLKIDKQKAKFYLDELARKHNLIDWTGSMNPDTPEHYRLNHEGRRLLVKRGIFG